MHAFAYIFIDRMYKILISDLRLKIYKHNLCLIFVFINKKSIDGFNQFSTRFNAVYQNVFFNHICKFYF